MILFNIQEFDFLDSTNSEAVRQIRDAANDKNPYFENLNFKVIMCNWQSRGRGTFGKSWFSPKGNLYVSILIPLNFIRNMNNYGQFSIASGVAVVKTIKYYLKNDFLIHLKWPNDVFVGEKKIAGILVEIEEPYAVIGLGINIATAPKTNQPTTCLGEGFLFPSPHNVINTLLRFFSDVLISWNDKGFRSIQESWYSSSLDISKLIHIRGQSGYFERIGDSGELIIKQNGEEKRIFSL